MGSRKKKTDDPGPPNGDGGGHEPPPIIKAPDDPDGGPYVPPPIVQKIVRVIEDRRLKRVAIEDQAELARYRIYNWETKSGQPNVAQALSLSRVLDVPLEYLIDDHTPPQSPPPRRVDSDLVAISDAARAIGIGLRQVVDSMVVLRAMQALGLDADAAIRGLYAGTMAGPSTATGPMTWADQPQPEAKGTAQNKGRHEGGRQKNNNG